jgi:hypothetical protein
MEAEFNVAYRLLLTSTDISNFCKAFVYMKARAERDARLRASERKYCTLV